MAKMYPDPLPHYVTGNPLRSTECAVYRGLRDSLGDDWHVFYSRPWLGLRPDGAEVDGEADFVVAHPDLGLLVIEVKGGVVSRDGSSDCWMSRDRHGVTHVIKDPVRQARESKYCLLRKIQDSRLWTGGFINARHAVVLPGSGRPKDDLGPDMPLDIFAFMDDCGDLGGWAERRLRTRPDPRTSALGTRGISLLIKILARSFELTPALRSSLAEMERDITRLSAEQFSVLDQLAMNRRMLIRGGAGTGKTVLALEKAFRLAGEGRRTLLTCYNRPLGEHLSALTRGQSEIVAGSFHQVCLDLINRAGLSPPDRRMTSERAYFSELLPESLLRALEASPDLRFDAVIADEGQDFEPEWWEILELCLTSSNGTLYIFLDDNQQVRYQSASVPDYPGFLLTQNLRNAKEVFRAASRFYTGGPYIGQGPDGGLVETIPTGHMDQATVFLETARWLKKLIRSQGVPPGKVAVLAPTSRMAEALRGSPAGEVSQWCAADQLSDDAVVIDSVRRFKGLERAVIALTGLEEIVCSPELMYTATTRATVRLVLIGPAVLADGLLLTPS
jgi:hypothetical protein